MQIFIPAAVDGSTTIQTVTILGFLTYFKSLVIWSLSLLGYFEDMCHLLWCIGLVWWVTAHSCLLYFRLWSVSQHWKHFRSFCHRSLTLSSTLSWASLDEFGCWLKKRSFCRIQYKQQVIDLENKLNLCKLIEFRFTRKCLSLLRKWFNSISFHLYYRP